MNMAQQLLGEAISKQRAGNFKEAEKLYRQALKQGLPDSDALRCSLNLGEILVQLDKPKLAIGVYNTALRRHPDSVDLLNASGITHALTGHLDQAEKYFQKALSLTPGNAVNAFNLAKIYKQKVNLENAEHYYRLAIQWQPDMAIAYNNLGNVLAEQGKHPDAVECIKKAIVLQADYTLAYNNLGQVFAQMDRHEEAVPIYQHAIKLKTDYLEAYTGLAKSLKSLGKYQQAIETYSSSLQCTRDSHEQAAMYNDLGDIYMLAHQLNPAQASFEHAIRLNPDLTVAQSNLGVVLFAQQRYQEAEIIYKNILRKDPNSYYANDAYGDILRMQCRYNEALDCYEKAIRLNKNFKLAHAHRLYTLSYHVLRDPKEILKAHMEWDRQFAASEKERFTHNRRGDINKRLRIGYLSPDFKSHSISYFFEPILANHDHEKFDIYCYAEVANPDEYTARLQTLSDHWCFTTGMSDIQLARRIHDDQIDILIDLAGHTRDSRILACTYKPAPIQATYLGYFSTTGLATMDYWISDAVLTPQNTIEQSVETICNLDRCCLAYSPPAEIPDVSLPQHPDIITFGSFNDLSKVSDEAIELWAAVLNHVPSSRLLLKAKQLHDTSIRKQILEKFSAYGITSDRIELSSRTPSKRDHLALYGNIDIALDTLPRTGGATTMEALWMGVPVVTLAGNRFIERLSTSILTALNRNEWIASTKEEYVAKAVALAHNPAQRADLRQTLRQQVMTSSVYDGEGLARSLERAYRDMWQKYLAAERG